MYRILAQHKDFMVINKGPGLGMHDETDEAGLLHPGLVSRVKADTGLLLYPVHRLDKMTSGLVLLARTTEANRALSMAFAAREVSKQYLALSDRKPKKKQGWVKGDMQKGRAAAGCWRAARTTRPSAGSTRSRCARACGSTGSSPEPARPTRSEWP